MKKEIRIALIMPVLVSSAFLLIILNPEGILAVQYTNHTSDRYQIKFQYPANWEFKEKMNRFDEGTEISVQNIALDNFGLITLGWDNDTTRAFGSSDFTTAFYDTFRDSIGSDYSQEYRVIEQPSFLNIDGKKTGTFLYTFKDKYEDNAETWGVQTWLTFVGDHGYLLSFMAPTRTFDSPESMEIRDNFIKSIKFLGNTTSTNATSRFD